MRRSAAVMRSSSRSAVSSSQSRSCTNASCRPAACATRSAVPSPSTVRWAARRRRSRTEFTIVQSSATTATPAAASATMPCVEVRSSTG